MRRAFTSALVELAETDERVLLLTGDLGFTVIEPFAERFPARFVNVGVAEQNMIGVATGLAEAGFLPFTYSIATFLTLRPYEFIRNGPALQRLPVRLVGVGGGLEYGHNGPTHYGIEDVGLMRMLPAMTILTPADHLQARAALRASWDLDGPVYYRLGKDETTVVAGLEGGFELGRAQLLGSGGDVLIVAMGNSATEAAVAVDALAADGVEATLLVVSSVTPPPTADLLAALEQFPQVITVEEHSVAGGVGSLVAEVVAEHGLTCRLTRCGVRTLPHGVSATHERLRRIHGVSADAIAASARQLVESARR